MAYTRPTLLSKEQQRQAAFDKYDDGTVCGRIKAYLHAPKTVNHLIFLNVIFKLLTSTVLIFLWLRRARPMTRFGRMSVAWVTVGDVSMTNILRTVNDFESIRVNSPPYASPKEKPDQAESDTIEMSGVVIPSDDDAELPASASETVATPQISPPLLTSEPETMARPQHGNDDKEYIRGTQKNTRKVTFSEVKTVRTIQHPQEKIHAPISPSSPALRSEPVPSPAPSLPSSEFERVRAPQNVKERNFDEKDKRSDEGYETGGDSQSDGGSFEDITVQLHDGSSQSDISSYEDIEAGPRLREYDDTQSNNDEDDIYDDDRKASNKKRN